MKRKRLNWLKSEYWATKASLEVAQCAFLESGAIGIEIDDGLGPEGARIYPEDRILIKAYFDAEIRAEDIEETLRHFLLQCGLPRSSLKFSTVEEEDWQGNFVRSCTSFKVEPDIFIVPSFEIDEFKKQSLEKLYIEMDPENAFGTGQHQTTKLCLTNIHELLCNRLKTSLPNLTCLDVGTGSGILAILMKKLGAPLVIASEIDEDALMTAQKNARNNGVLIKTQLVKESHRYEENTYDLVVANILAVVLIDRAKNLVASLRSSGMIILSGILIGQADKVCHVFEALGVMLVKKDVMDDWCALIFEKK